MENNENKTNFDLAMLSPKELVDLYFELETFLEYLEKKKIKDDSEVTKNG